MPTEQSVKGIAQSSEQLGSLGSGYQFAWAGYFEALGLLFAILATLWLGVWFLKRRTAQGLSKGNAELRIENRLPIDAKRWLLVVRFKGKHLLLGVTEQNISTLATLDEKNNPTADIAQEKKDTPKDSLLAFESQTSTLELRNFENVLRGEREQNK